MLAFDNTKISYKHLSNKDLRLKKRLFKILKSTPFSGMCSKTLLHFLTHNYPVLGFYKGLILKNFWVGNNVEDFKEKAEKIWQQGVYSAPLYMPKANEDSSEVYNEYLRMIKFVSKLPYVPIIPIQFSHLISPRVLKLVAAQTLLNKSDQKLWDTFQAQIDTLCELIIAKDIRVLFEAETPEIQPAVEAIAFRLMKLYNTHRPMVNLTYSFLNNISFNKLTQNHRTLVHEKITPGYGLAGGIFWETGNINTSRNESLSELTHQSKETNSAIKYLLTNIESCSLISLTHNIDRVLYLTSLMDSQKIAKNDNRSITMQYMGLADHISFNLANSGFNVVKIIPYGCPKETSILIIRQFLGISYLDELIRTELKLTKKEIARRAKEI
ncbi:MAG: proline dehydrogenase family protein [Bacteroidales bacterium]|nr:proline dehydrogenase family protein [Bacteroidales bacterium]HPD94257.1 proline dehydrogenase family protein [Tenuifilaceae bacterium]